MNDRMSHPQQVVVFCAVRTRAATEHLLKVLQPLLDSGQAHRVHLWNYMENPEDENWLCNACPIAQHRMHMSPYVRSLVSRYPSSRVWGLIKNLHPSHGLLDEIKITIEPTPAGSAVVIPTVNKSRPIEMLAHYSRTHERYRGAVLVKVDESVVYLDSDRFAAFVALKRMLPRSLLVVPSVLNNSVCSHFQQRWGVLPVSAVGILPYETTSGGKLGSSGALAHKLHSHFLAHADDIRAIGANFEMRVVEHTCGENIALDVFAISGEDLHVFSEAAQCLDGADADRILATRMTRRLGRAIAIDMSTMASCSSMGSQTDSGLDDTAVRTAYARRFYDAAT